MWRVFEFQASSFEFRFSFLPGFRRLAGVIYESDERRAGRILFHAEFTECAIDGKIAVFYHGVHGEDIEAPP